jgi:hypothetical protein
MILIVSTAGGAMDAFAWEAGPTRHVVYGRPDGHVWEATWRTGKWSAADLTDEASAPAATDHQGQPVSPSVRGFEWPGRDVKQVVYKSFSVVGSAKQGIHELWVTKGTKWRHVNLSAATGAVAVSDVVGFTWATGRSKQYVYAGPDGGIRELYVVVGGEWNEANLGALTSAPASSGWGITGYEWRAAGTKQVAYVTNGTMHELFVGKNGTWRHANLSNVVGLKPNLVSPGPIQGFGWDAGKSKQVFYRVGNHIHELSAPLGGKWAVADLTKRAVAPDIGTYGTFHAFASGDSKYVVYTAPGSVHLLSVKKGGSWTHRNLTAEFDAPPPGHLSPSIRGYAFDIGGTKSIAYFDDDGHLWDVTAGLDGKWIATDVTGEAGAPPNS